MRILAKILASLVAPPLSLMIITSGIVLLNGNTSDGLSPGDTAPYGMVALMLSLVWLAAIWLPGIRRRWLAAAAGGGAMLVGSLVAMFLGDLVFLSTFDFTIAALVRGLGYAAVMALAVTMMRRPAFTR